MQESHEVLWRVFNATGHIGAYLLYKEIMAEDNGGDEAIILDQLR